MPKLVAAVERNSNRHHATPFQPEYRRHDTRFILPGASACTQLTRFDQHSLSDCVIFSYHHLKEWSHGSPSGPFSLHCARASWRPLHTLSARRLCFGSGKRSRKGCFQCVLIGAKYCRSTPIPFDSCEHSQLDLASWIYGTQCH